MLKITVLGPWGAYPKVGEATAGYLLEVEGQKVLIDCGSGVLATLQKYIALHELTAVFVSHHHFDHVADLGCLQYACLIDTDLKKRDENLRVFIADDEKASAYKQMNGSSIELITEENSLTLGGLDVQFFPTFHDGYCLGMRIQYKDQIIVYTADTRFDDQLISHCKNADLLIAETSFYAEYEAKNYGHMNTTEVARLANEAKVKRVVLTHLPHFGVITQLEEEVKGLYNGEVILAKTGLELTM